MPELNRSSAIRCMRKALQKIQHQPSLFPRCSQLMNATLHELATEGVLTDQDQSYEFRDLTETDARVILLTEAYQQLLNLGDIIPEPNPQGPPNPNGFWITEAGRQWAGGSADPVPEDPQGYFAALDTLIPHLDPVIREYVKEALVTYERRAFFAAAVMIGAASEKAIYLLMEALLAAATDPKEKKAIQKAIEERRLPTMFKRLSENINRAKSSRAMPYAVHEGADAHLLSLQEAIRVQRNDAVHPQVEQVTPQTVHLTIAAFPAACRKTYNLIEWLRVNPI